MPLMSMTGFADLAGSAGGVAWVWDARSVNARGFDLRLRLPEGLEGLEAPLRAAFGQRFSRGAVSVSLRLGAATAGRAPRLNPEALEAAIGAALAAAEAAQARGLDLAPMTAADLLGLRGVVESEARAPGEVPDVVAALAASVEPLAAALGAARAEEGARLEAVLAAQLDRIADLVAAARTLAEGRGARQGEVLRARLEAVLAATAAVDPARLAQELALVAVRADVTEELDRLEAHLAAARGLLGGTAAAGRRLDFLTQEFNREANTLCAKAQAVELTAVGLDLKVVIDQFREQVQNVE